MTMIASSAEAASYREGRAFDMNAPWVESQFFESILRSKNLSPEQSKVARCYHENGFVILENIASNDLIDEIISKTKPLYRPDMKDGPRSFYRVQDAWREVPAVGRLASDTRVIETLRFLYDRAPIPFQTLNFLHGSQQRAHSDSVHFSCIPSGYMCGVWVALEDVDAGNGPLFYYPGSNRLPEFSPFDVGIFQGASEYPKYEDFIESLMAERGYKRQILEIKKGSALIWSANLVHGGSPIHTPGRTRLSQVTHFYFENSIYYTPIFSNPVTGEYALKEIIDTRTGERVPHRYNGMAVFPMPQADGRCRLSFGDAGGLTVEGNRIRELENTLSVIVNSNAYRIGRMITAPVRGFKKLLKR